MDIFGQMAAAAARYQNAQEPTEEDRLKALEARAEHLLETSPVPLMEPAITPTLNRPSQRQDLERIIVSLAGEGIPPAILRKGLEITRSVALVSTASESGSHPVGTGFLVSPTLLLTAAHVLPDENAVRGSVARFDFETQQDGSFARTSEFALNQLVVRNEALDYVLVEIRSDENDAPGNTYGWCGLDRARGEVVAGERLQIVGHPRGGPKLVSQFDNEVVHVLQHFLQYSASTDVGSSGSPVFNMQWELVAMHHASAFKKSPFGDRWLSEGTRVNAILQNLDQHNLLYRFM